MTWEYQRVRSGEVVKIIVTNFAPRELKGKKVTPQRWQAGNSSGSFDFIAEDRDGIYEFAHQKPEDVEPKIYKSPNYWIKYPIQVGTAWDKITETSLLSDDVIVTLNYNIESIDEVVTVPAGTFEGCVKVKGVGATQKDLGDSKVANINVEYYSWFAPGVGLIKWILKEKKEKPWEDERWRVDSEELTIELVSFKKNEVPKSLSEKILH